MEEKYLLRLRELIAKGLAWEDQQEPIPASLLKEMSQLVYAHAPWEVSEDRGNIPSFLLDLWEKSPFSDLCPELGDNKNLISCVATSSDGKQILIGIDDLPGRLISKGIVYNWEGEKTSFEIPFQFISDMIFSKNGAYMLGVFQYEDTTPQLKLTTSTVLCLHDSSGKQLKTFSYFEDDQLEAFGISSDAQFVFALSEKYNVLTVWDIEGNEIQNRNLTDEHIFTFDQIFAPDGASILLAKQDGGIEKWNFLEDKTTRHGSINLSVLGQEKVDKFDKARLDPHGTYILLQNQNKDIALMTLKGELKWKMNLPRVDIEDCSPFSHAGNYIMMLGMSKASHQVHLYTIEGDLVADYGIHSQAWPEIQFGHDESYILVWDLFADRKVPAYIRSYPMPHRMYHALKQELLS